MGEKRGRKGPENRRELRRTLNGQGPSKAITEIAFASQRVKSWVCPLKKKEKKRRSSANRKRKRAKRGDERNYGFVSPIQRLSVGVSCQGKRKRPERRSKKWGPRGRKIWGRNKQSGSPKKATRTSHGIHATSLKKKGSTWEVQRGDNVRKRRGKSSRSGNRCPVRVEENYQPESSKVLDDSGHDGESRKTDAKEKRTGGKKKMVRITARLRKAWTNCICRGVCGVGKLKKKKKETKKKKGREWGTQPTREKRDKGPMEKTRSGQREKKLKKKQQLREEKRKTLINDRGGKKKPTCRFPGWTVESCGELGAW